MKRTVRLRESELRHMISESVRRVLNEWDYDANKASLESSLRGYLDADDDDIPYEEFWKERDFDLNLNPQSRRDRDKVKQRRRAANKIAPLELKDFAKRHFCRDVSPTTLDSPRKRTAERKFNGFMKKMHGRV